MTGHGDARHESTGCRVAVEIRTVNNRYFKLLVRCPESYASLESKIEAFVRERIRRGTVSVSLRIERDRAIDDFRVNTSVLKNYQRQLLELSTIPVGWGELLQLPGVVDEPSSTAADLDSDWPAIEPALVQAISSLQEMRSAEGAATEADLQANCLVIARELQQIEARCPLIVELYQQRLADRLNKLLHAHETVATPADIIREIGLFSERCDISEETVRLNSHLQQFATIITTTESAGRKLEFLIQEMFREANTIGSKANDAEVAMHVVEIKTCIERMREQIQNVE